MSSHIISNRLRENLMLPGLLKFIREDQAHIIDGTPGFPVAGGSTIRYPIEELKPEQERKLDHWQHLVNAAKNVIDGVHVSVGTFMRDVPNGAPSGTAFVVGPRLVLTNRHVADNVFSLPANDADVLAAPPVISARHFLSFSEEGDGDPRFSPVRVLAASAPLDYALIEVGGPVELPRKLTLVTTPENPDPPGSFATIQLAGQPEHIIKRLAPPDPLPDYPWAFGVGYPVIMPWDMNRDTAFVFNGVSGAKIVLPGLVLKLVKCPLIGVMEKLVVFESTYSSLPNCSGMPLCRSDNGKVVGLHFDGQADLGNYAVPSWTIVEDLRAKLGPTPEGPDILRDMGI